MFTIGVTGGIGSGKSYVCHLLEVASLPVFYTDIEAKRILVENESVREKMIELFGPQAYIEVEYLDSKNAKSKQTPKRPQIELDRKHIADMVFNDASLRQKMNAIVHPAVMNEFLEWKLRQESKVVVVESAILYESGFDKMVDKVVMVTAPKEVRIARVKERDNASVEDIEKRINAQMDESEKLRRADYVIKNGPHDDLNPQIFTLLLNLREHMF